MFQLSDNVSQTIISKPVLHRGGAESWQEALFAAVMESGLSRALQLIRRICSILGPSLVHIQNDQTNSIRRTTRSLEFASLPPHSLGVFGDEGGGVLWD